MQTSLHISTHASSPLDVWLPRHPVPPLVNTPSSYSDMPQVTNQITNEEINTLVEALLGSLG